MQKRFAKFLKSFIGLAISAALIIWLLQALDWQLVWAELKDANYLVLIPVTILTIAQFMVRAMRWRYLLPTCSELSFAKLFAAIMVGNLATFILPLRAGEFIRPLFLTKDTKGQLSFAVTFGSIVIERLFDLLCVLITFAIILPFLPTLPDWVSSGAIYLTALALIILILLVWAIFSPATVTAISSVFCRPLPKSINARVQLLLAEMLSGAKVLKDTRNLIWTIIFSVVMWLLNYLSLYVALFMFAIDHSWLLGTTTAVVMALAVAAPSAPGFVGILQVASVASFLLFGESAEVATSYAIILHVLQYLIYIVFGGWALSTRGLKLGTMTSAPAS